MSTTDTPATPAATLPDGVTVVRRHVWTNFSPEIVIEELSDGSSLVNGERVAGRPEYDGMPPPGEHFT